MKMVKKVILSTLLSATFSSVASVDLHNKLIIQAIPESEGTVVVEGVPKYEKTFKLAVWSKTKEPIELTGFVGCYKAFDEQGKEFNDRVIQADLLGTLKDGTAKTGHISFVSDDDTVYNAKFVKWSTQCPHLSSQTE